MGYCMSQIDSKFRIKAQNIAGAVAAIKALEGKEEENHAGGASWKGGVLVARHYSWVDKGFSQLNDIAQLMDAWRWDVKVKRDAQGSAMEVTGIEFHGEKWGDDETLFKAIAPFVEAGSFITMEGEDNAVWAWAFDGSTCTELALGNSHRDCLEKYQEIMASMHLWGTIKR